MMDRASVEESFREVKVLPLAARTGRKGLGCYRLLNEPEVKVTSGRADRLLNKPEVKVTSGRAYRKNALGC